MLAKCKSLISLSSAAIKGRQKIWRQKKKNVRNEILFEVVESWQD
jgi:hypothetical protein